ncbi:hypothetical protein CHX27_02310 [Flavobacterium aurantiibacter]|uniref:Uncharacterized protein n=1 Tax=Flavobacterium aurantiibacter TaxID=2023067 RepID=A0A256A3Z2_9FLAO|nr:hypothetical protein CHX27_02310 [Flavobacterium aurantiibacter]
MLAAIQAAKVVSATALKGLLASPCKAKPQSTVGAFISAPPANATACTNNHSRERIAKSITSSQVVIQPTLREFKTLAELVVNFFSFSCRSVTQQRARTIFPENESR